MRGATAALPVRAGRWPTWTAARAPSLGEAQVHVWRAHLPALRESVRNLQGTLAASRHRALPDEPDHRGEEHALGRLVLRMLLGRYLHAAPGALAIGRAIDGKPELARPRACSGVQFNLAHSGAWLLCAVSRNRRVGVDVERRRSVDVDALLATGLFAAEERALVTAAPTALRERRFFELWTAKEACAKASGLGVWKGFGDSVVRRLGSDASSGAAGDGSERRLTLQQLAVARGYSAALATEGPAPAISRATFDLRFWLPRAMRPTAGSAPVALPLPHAFRLPGVPA